ncbi:MAG: oxidoreductase [Nocardiaceae bacterium]|nr:oxidoreductase [Nocardiaceae bacterium]
MSLPGVEAAALEARNALSQVHRHRANLRGWNATAAEASWRSARASSAIEGGAAEMPADGMVTEPIMAGSIRVGQELVGDSLDNLIRVWQRAPLQALARLHLLAAADLVADPDQLGRPRQDPVVSERLHILNEILTSKTTISGAVLAAIVHGEILALRPFGTADGIVARAASRLVCVSSGLDPHALGVPEVFWLGRLPLYREAAAGFATGTPEALTKWITLCCDSFTMGAKEALAIANAAAEAKKK